MNVKLENLEKIDDILNLLNHLTQKINGEKRWLNTSEAAHYLGYSQDHLHKLKNDHFIENKHYHKKAGRILFDKYELDNWVKSGGQEIDPKKVVDQVLTDLI